MSTTASLTPASSALILRVFDAICQMAGTADGTGAGYVSDAVTDEADKGNLTDLKTKGLVKTFKDNGILWVNLTDAGRVIIREQAAEQKIPLAVQ